jgi:integrase
MARPATGTVVERQRDRGRVYGLRFSTYGKRRFLTLPDGTTRHQAEEELANVLADVRRGVWQPDAPVEEPRTEPTFHEFASLWFDQHQAGLRARTREDYRWALSHHLLPFFAKHRLGQITIEEIDRYRAQQLRAGTLGPNTINKTITRLAQVLEVAVEYRYLDANPARGRRRRAKAAAPRRTWLEPEHVKPLVEAASVRGQRGGNTSPDPRSRAIVATAICAGLRISELLALRWRDVDLAAGRLTVRASKTDAGERTVDLWPELRDELLIYKPMDARRAAFVFATASGKADTRGNIAKRLRRAVARANVALEADGGSAIPDDLTPRSLRRTFAALLYERGEDPVYVMDQLGHTDPKLALRIYTKVVSRQRRRGRGERLVSVLAGAEWAPIGISALETPTDAESHMPLLNEKTPR